MLDISSRCCWCRCYYISFAGFQLCANDGAKMKNKLLRYKISERLPLRHLVNRRHHMGMKCTWLRHSGSDYSD